MKILECQNTDNPVKLKELFAEKAEVIKEITTIVLENETVWGTEDTGGINTSKDAIKKLKHFINYMADLEKFMPKTTRPSVKQELEDGIKDCIKRIEITLTSWTEWIEPKDKPQNLAPITEPTQSITKQQPPQQSSQETPQPQENSREQTKETTEAEVQGLIPVDDTPIKAPVLAKNLSIANRGQIIIHNNFYKVNLGTLGELENNLFFSLCNRLKDKNDTIIRFSPQELKALAGDPYMPNKRLYKLTADLFNNIAGANFDLIRYLPNDNISRSKVMFFRVFTVEYDKQKNVKYLDIQVNNPYFTYLLNDLKANFTSMKLQTFIDLSGKYAKNLFRLLEQFKNAAKNAVFEVYSYENNFEGFCAFMGIPKGTRISDIDIYMLNPAIKQLTQKTPKNPFEPPYKAVKVIKNKAKTRGGRVLGYTFEVTINPAIQELEKAQESSKTPLKRFTKKDLKILESLKEMRGKLSVKDKEGKDFTFNDAMIEDIKPSPKTRKICVQFRVNGVLDPEILSVIALYKKYTNYFGVDGNEYLTLVFEDLEDLKNKFLNTAHKTNSPHINIAKTPKATTKHTATKSQHNTPAKNASDLEIYIFEKPIPEYGGKLVVNCQNGHIYTFNKVQLVAKVKDTEHTKATQENLKCVLKILEPTDTDLKIAKNYFQNKQDINFFKQKVPTCTSPEFFIHTFKTQKDFDMWMLQNIFSGVRKSSTTAS
ncbi:replication initiation protein [Helicobacter felistomachi]|uniref:replication initiation protein n=1 Tax=Helicobacter felistomachi TaxID=3040201 RepID=UPI002572E084|nr:replication initiation protein [Helicobacter sp. NHP21005]